MSSKRNKAAEIISLANKIEKFGTILLIPCDRCCRLDRACIKAEGSTRCSNCVRAGNCRCTDMGNSEASWKRLISAQDQLDADEEKAREEMARIMAKLSRLQKQKKLLRKRAGQFLQTDIKDVEELEKLEEEEEARERRRLEEEERKASEERAKLEAARKEQELIASMLNSGDTNGLVVDDSSWLASFSFPNQSSLDTPESYRGNSNS